MINWTPIPMHIEDNVYKANANQPIESGEYLCTCIRKIYDENGEFMGYNRYLRVMCYDKTRNSWHDLNHLSGISHIILAWTNDVPACDFDNFTFESGGVLIEK